MTSTATADRSASPQLEADLSLLLDRVLGGGAQELLRCLAVHEMTPLHARVLRELVCCPLPLTVDALSRRMELDTADVVAAAAELRRRRLIGRRDTTSALLQVTPDGRRIDGEIDRAHRADLRAYVGELDRTGRRRLEAALSLLHHAA